MKRALYYTKKIIHIKLAIAVLLLLPLAVLTLVVSKTDRIAGIQSFVVLTGSMEPNISQGSLIFTKKASDYRIGEVIAYKTGEVTVTHRIVEVVKVGTNISYQTQGDANNTADTTLIPASRVLGKATNSLPYIGSFILSLKTIEGFFAVIILPALLFIGFELWNIKKEIERQAEKRVLKRLQIT